MLFDDIYEFSNIFKNMGRKPRWTTDFNHGIQTVNISSWKYFHDYLQEELLDFKTYVFRGQGNEKWLLEPSINRFFKKNGKTSYEIITRTHLENFKFSLRGRIAQLKDIIQDENELWALGQHHGLVTPLLDFSFSPYVAAFFAFNESNVASKNVAIYAISQYSINNQIKEELNIYKPTSDYNPRLISQSGLFIKFDTDKDIESLFKGFYKEDESKIKLYRILIPKKDRDIALRLLNRMNINYNTLFPDLNGASMYCNMELEIKSY